MCAGVRKSSQGTCAAAGEAGRVWGWDWEVWRQVGQVWAALGAVAQAESVQALQSVHKRKQCACRRLRHCCCRCCYRTDISQTFARWAKFAMLLLGVGAIALLSMVPDAHDHGGHTHGLGGHGHSHGHHHHH